MKDKIEKINPNTNFNLKKFPDDTFIQTREDYILIDLKEDNVEFLSENFDIEVYMISEDKNKFDNTNNEILIPLFFEKKKQQIINDILVEDNEARNSLTALASFNSSFIKYFMDILVDQEIPPEILCKNLTDEQKKELINLFEFDCEDDREILITTHRSDVETIEKC